MLVDDTPANLKLLEEMLRERSYRVRSFPKGRLALSAAASEPPDLILLDVNMPEMNGFEVCERLKSDPELARVPVIFISALNEPLDKVTAFRCGGVDYVTKPFQFEEVRARIDTHQLAVEAHGGRIGVVSEAGEGSTFWFVLPGAVVPGPCAGASVVESVAPCESNGCACPA